MNTFLEYINTAEQESILRESKQTNKFDIKWQIVRTDARDIKDPSKKLSFVLNFLEKNPSKQNYDRVANWVKMTGVSYKGNDREKFEKAHDKLKQDKEEYKESNDEDNDLSKINTSELQKVYKDLSKRKYGFQFKSVPKAHTEFINAVEKELKSRNNS